MRKGLTDAEMAEEALQAGRPIKEPSIADIRRILRHTLNDTLVPAPSDAQNQAAIYQELLNYSTSPELAEHIMTRLNQLRQLDPAVKLTPLGARHRGSAAPTR